MKWIPIDDETPPVGEKIVIYCPSGDTDDPHRQICTYLGDGVYEGLFPYWKDKITHWKPWEDPNGELS